MPSIAFHLSYLYTKSFTGRQIGCCLFARIWTKRYDMIKLELQKSDMFPLIPRYILEPSLKWIGDSAPTLWDVDSANFLEKKTWAFTKKHTQKENTHNSHVPTNNDHDPSQEIFSQCWWILQIERDCGSTPFPVTKKSPPLEFPPTRRSPDVWWDHGSTWNWWDPGAAPRRVWWDLKMDYSDLFQFDPLIGMENRWKKLKLQSNRCSSKTGSFRECNYWLQLVRFSPPFWKICASQIGSSPHKSGMTFFYKKRVWNCHQLEILQFAFFDQHRKKMKKTVCQCPQVPPQKNRVFGMQAKTFVLVIVTMTWWKKHTWNPKQAVLNGWKWWFPTIPYIKIWNPIETTIYKQMAIRFCWALFFFQMATFSEHSNLKRRNISPRGQGSNLRLTWDLGMDGKEQDQLKFHLFNRRLSQEFEWILPGAFFTAFWKEPNCRFIVKTLDGPSLDLTDFEKNMTDLSKKVPTQMDAFFFWWFLLLLFFAPNEKLESKFHLKWCKEKTRNQTLRKSWLLGWLVPQTKRHLFQPLLQVPPKICCWNFGVTNPRPHLFLFVSCMSPSRPLSFSLGFFGTNFEASKKTPQGRF